MELQTVLQRVQKSTNSKVSELRLRLEKGYIFTFTVVYKYIRVPNSSERNFLDRKLFPHFSVLNMHFFVIVFTVFKCVPTLNPKIYFPSTPSV